MIRQVAPSRATVLILARAAPAKELVAKAIHQLTPANANPWSGPCAALAAHVPGKRTLRHEKGALTGAHERRIGRFEQAQGGTLFLDEIGESTPPPGQAPFASWATHLRTCRLEQNAHRPTCACPPATTRTWPSSFRPAPFARTSISGCGGGGITLPPLRERPERHPTPGYRFVREFALENQKPVKRYRP